MSQFLIQPFVAASFQLFGVKSFLPCTLAAAEVVVGAVAWGNVSWEVFLLNDIAPLLLALT